MDEHPQSAGGQPAVGNVLGFSLLLRDRQALLRLERRALQPGVRLLEYEAEVPDVTFPLRAQGASSFRRRRCRAGQLRLELELRAVGSWVDEHLRGHEIAGLHLDEVALRLGADGPLLLLSGTRDGGRAWLGLVLRLRPVGRRLACRPWRTWRMGRGAPRPEAMWEGLAERMGLRLDPDGGEVMLDPARGTLLRPFVEAGWRVPDLGALVVHELMLSPDRVELLLGRRSERLLAAPIPARTEGDDELGEHLQRVYAALERDNRATARAELERLAESLPPEHPARLPVLRWLVDLARVHDAPRALRALQAWLYLQPRDDEAARALIIALGRTDGHRGLAQRLAGQCRLPHSPRRQARLELSLACVLVDRLHDGDSAIGLLSPLLDRCLTQPPLRELERPVRAALARALASRPDADPNAALDALGRALATIPVDGDRESAKASLVAGVASALAHHGHHREAMPLWRRAVHAAADDDELVDRALASINAAGDDVLAIEILRTAIPRATPEAALPLRRRLVTTLLGRTDPTSHELALAELRALVRENPQSRELALELSALERHGGRPDEAAALLGRLAESTEEAEDRTRLRLEQARLLTEGGQPRRAWALLEPELRAPIAELELELLDLAVDIAPLSVRDALIDRLVELDDGPRSGKALLERGRSRRSNPQRRADLETAAQRLDDPLPALRELAALAAPDDPEPWASLAQACSVRGDVDGETAARVELALRHLGHGMLDPAAESLSRARALHPADPALPIAHAWVEARAGHFDDAAALLVAVPPGRLPLSSHPLSDPRLGLPPQLEQSEPWIRTMAQLPPGDPRRLEPSVMLARIELANGHPQAARDRLLPVLGQRGVPREAYEILAEAAHALGDATTRLRALRGIAVHAKDGPERLHAELELARQLGEAGRSREGLSHAATAARGWPTGSDEHVDATRLWLRLATTADDASEQAAARAALREALGPELSVKEHRAEALLLAERLDDLRAAQGVLEHGLAIWPADPLLLSTLKHVMHLGGTLEPYLVALDAAIEGLAPGPERDRLATELALSAAEFGDAARVYRALEHCSIEAGESEDLLDLREWAVHTLGLEDQELRRIDERLQTGLLDLGLLRRLSRLVGPGEPTVEHLVAQAREAPPEIARLIIEPALVMATPLAMPSLSMRVLRHAIGVGALEAAQSAWPPLLARVSETKDDAALADLVALADDARALGMQIDETIELRLDEALAERPGSPHLHRALARHLALRGGAPPQQHAARIAHLDAVADRFELSGADRARLFVGMAEPLDRRSAAELLEARARAAFLDPPAFGRLIRALEVRQCWPEVLRLLSACAEATTEVQDKVGTLKHLAHVASDVLGDPTAAVAHLEAALALAPTDPDLLLPLLDHHFSQTDLGRAVELSERVLDHVRMGDAAFAALAHRAADAAIAQGEAQRAATLLERIIERLPDDAKAGTRLEELHHRTDDPTQRVALLAAVATRQSGKARIEALEERARLLLELQRFDEAMEDLAAVIADAPERRESAELLAELYREHGRFIQLVELREAELPRRHGQARAKLLTEIAEIYRDGLHDLSRAEQALRLAIEQLGVSPEERALADQLREALAEDLEQQGRAVDLCAWLDKELATELELPAQAPAPEPPRLALLQRLARLVRDRQEGEAKAARIYEQLERWHALPDEGLAPLARWYSRHGRHDALVRVLQLRAQALPELGERRAAVELRIAELLDGPLLRPHDAAPHYLDAYLADPETHAAAGNRARVLLLAVDSIVNVRDRLLRRLAELPHHRRPHLLTLLADVLAPHEAHEDEAEARYREALVLDDHMATAHEGLGRLLARRGRKHEAALALVAAIERPGLSPERAAEAAALAARNLLELRHFERAEAVLRQALTIRSDSPRVLLELARLYERTERAQELAQVLDQLAGLPLSGSTMAEVAYRRALLLQPVYEVVPQGPQGERARSLMLEALGANPRHAAARQTLLSLATARREWSIVAHMHYLAIRDLPPGPQRATVHLELAAVYLEQLADPDSAMRNIESALQQAATDVVVTRQLGELARRLPDRAMAAARFEAIAGADSELDDPARARLWLLAAELRMEADDREAAAAASRRVLELADAPEDATAAATRTLERTRDPASLLQTRDALLAQLDAKPPGSPSDRAELLARLHDIGVALDDPSLVERAHREQSELAAALDESDDQAAGAVLRDLLAARGDYGAVVELSERLASQTSDKDPERAATVLVEAAGYAWRGQKQPAHAASLLGRALELRPEHEVAIRMLGELAHEVTDPAEAGAIQRALGSVSEGSPSLRLQLAVLANTRGDDDQALALLRPLTEADVPEDIRFRALERLEALLLERGEHDERRRVLTQQLTLALARNDPRTGDLGLELARLGANDGDRSAARRIGEAARGVCPEHRDLLRLLAELAERDEDWPYAVARLETLAQLATDDDEQAMWLTRAAGVYLRRPELPANGDGPGLARRMLLQAAELAPRSPEPRAMLLPLSFGQARWDEVLELGEAITTHAGHDEEVLVLAAVAEAHRRGERRLAREIGFRHPPEVLRRVLLPALQQSLGELARRGPLPRLDAVLAASSALLGGRSQLYETMHTWAGELPPDAGLVLGLARLLEARGAGDMARHHYQLAAFMAPRGPVPGLVARLPAGWLADTDLHRVSTAPMEGRSTLREILAALRDHLAGIEHDRAPEPAPARIRPPDWWPTRMELAETIVEPWRATLGVDLPLAWTEAPLAGGVTVRNDSPPRVLLGRLAATLTLPELTFRLALATASVALGLTVLEHDAVDLGVLLDALAQVANPGHQPTGPLALGLSDILVARDARNIGLTTAQRAAVLDEIAHWLTTQHGLGRLRVMLRRSTLLLATRLACQLDGALLALARDHGLFADGSVDAAGALQLPDAVWLLRALSLR
ncbi:hypothetical protein [Paraliomyxa miuraensis]|uniref:hypothetical protein n=1 Tax=Paraliomyxa miuraensis TaxID=376150 RepID=UPI002253F258|nr:hypothetical protein [Paraliomyxa miuraensis]MCX4242084.1 hypothetical protein [Paraliomyxa miuraensis]